MSLKSFITRPEDRIRQPYARIDTRSPRRTSFCATVNPRRFLRDDTGSRRFWTVPLEHINKEWLFSLTRDWVHQLWLQTYTAYLADPYGFRMSDIEIKELQSANEEFDVPVKYEQEILGMLMYDLPREQWEWWRASDLIGDRLPADTDTRQVGKALAYVTRSLWPDSTLKREYSHFNNGTAEYRIPLKHNHDDFSDVVL